MSVISGLYVSPAREFLLIFEPKKFHSSEVALLKSMPQMFLLQGLWKQRHLLSLYHKVLFFCYYQHRLYFHPFSNLLMQILHYPTVILKRSFLHLVFLLQSNGSFSLPIPMMTLLSSGKHAAGKQNLIKEVFILPQPGTPMQKVQMCEYALSVVVIIVIVYFLTVFLFQNQSIVFTSFST